MPASAAALVVVLTVAAQAPPRPPDTAPDRPTVAVQGCAQAGTITSITPDATDSANVLAAGRTYRLTGNKTLLNQIRQEHDGQLLEVTGTIKGGDDQPRMTTYQQKMGKTAIYLGTGESAPSSAPTVADLPRLEVQGFRVIDAQCPASNLGR
jgi:hypothetical protein